MRYPSYSNNPGSFNSEYVPADFREDIARYRDVTGDPCGYMRSGYLHPDYSVLEGNRLRYYFWWRTAMRRGIPEPTDPGYVWLRCTELVNSDGDPARILRDILELTLVCSNSDVFTKRLIDGFAEDYALAHGMSFEQIPRKHLFCDMEAITTWRLTRYPICVPDDIVDMVGGNYHSMALPIQKRRIVRIVKLSLEGIDECVRSSKGMGILRAVAGRWNTRVRDPFRRFAHFEPYGCTRVPVADFSGGGLPWLVDSIVRQAVALILVEGKGAPIVPKAFPMEYRRIVAAAVDAEMREDAWDPRMFRTGPPGAGFWGDDDLETETPETGGKAMIRGGLCPEGGRPAMRVRRMKEHLEEESDEPVPYFPSGCARTSYDSMSPEQYAFYIHWRTMARHGTFLDTDRGYMWLFCSETINQDGDPQGIQGFLERMLDAYDVPGSHLDDLREAAIGHALVCGLDPPAIRFEKMDIMACLKLGSVPIGRISPEMAGYLADWDLMRFTHGRRKLFEAALTAGYRAFDEHSLRNGGDRLIDMIGRSRRSHVQPIVPYRNLWHPDKGAVHVEYMVPRYAILQDRCEAIDRIVVRTVNKRMGESFPRPPKDLDAGSAEAIEDAVEKAIDDFEEREKREEAFRRISGFEIDRDAVSSAVADLEAVTGMMAVDEEQEAPVEIGPEPVPTGWDAFYQSLDEVEKAYLRNGRDALRGTGRRQSAVEDSVNGKAMDAVGDTVMNDGAVLPEYAEDIGRLME